MIVDTLKNWHHYHLGSTWTEVMTWIAAHGVTSPIGTYCAGDCSVFITRPTTRLLEESRYEAHCAMADVQIVLEGEEYFYQTDTANLTPAGPFNQEKDVGFYAMPTAESSRVRLGSGVFALVMPWDAHMPLVALDNKPSVLKKLVAKIPVERIQLG